MVKCVITLTVIAFYATMVQCKIINPIAIPQDDTKMSCPPEERLIAVLNDLQGRVREILINEVVVSTTASTGLPSTTTESSGNSLCGPGNWRPFFYLDMSDATQSCPSGWTFSQIPYRACTGVGNACVSTYIPSGGQGYSEVCGMLAGIGVGLADGFFRHNSNDMQSIEQNYMDGVSITYGPVGSRQHIWSLALGHTSRCPCDVHNSSFQQPFPPSEVGNNYYCSSISFSQDTPVWQGVDCSANNPCCSHNNPPIFKAQLAATTTETMELRICSDETTSDESLYVTYAEIYVQ